MSATEILTRDMAPQTDEQINTMARVPYRALVGSLIYAAVTTRPDIAHTVSTLSQFNQNPGMTHWTAAKRVLRYLKGTRGHQLTLGGDQPIQLEAYTDSNYAGDLDKRRSTSEYTMSLGGLGIISWSTKKQPTVATSSTEAEYIACCHTTKEVVWLRALLRAMGFPQTAATILWCDNQGAIALTEDPSVHARTKHIDVQYHYSRERVEMGEIGFKYIHTLENLADTFTKSLPETSFIKHHQSMGVQ